MKKIFTLLALTISFSMNSQMTDNSTDTSATGSYSVAMGNATTASGDFSTAMGRSTTASGGYSTSMGGYTIASGGYSTAMGYGSIASGSYSTAMGYDTRASGSDSTAMGFLTEASGDFSTAMGYYTIASGSTSTAMGNDTTASDYASTVIGQYNSLGSSVTNSANEFNIANTAFVIGNGVAANNRSDALTVLFDGTTNVAGSVTATSFIGDGSQLTNIASSSPFSFNDTSETGIQSGINTASGSDSTAMGFYSVASGQTSTAIGLATIASGGSSTAMGGFTTASGYASTAMGADTVASGMMSTAMGFLTTASDYSSLVIGRFNSLGSTVTNSADQFNIENTAFVIGNGVAADNRSDALTVLFDGTTNVAGSVTATSFIGDGSQLTNLASSSPFSLNNPNSSGSGIQSESNTASGYASTAMGFETAASGEYSSATGLYTTASGYASTAMGRETTVSGSASTAMGYFTTAIGNSSTAMGVNTTASGYASTAMGQSTTASGMMSTAMGFLTTASDYSSLVIGRFNSLGSTVTNSADQFNIENTAFVIGNGVAADNRSDAFTVMFNGDATLAGNLSVNSDAKLKSNIVSLGSTLAKVLMLDGKSYSMKNDPESSLKIGLVAQNIEQTYPELVSESNGIKSVNYQGLIPVLINAIKEQDEIIKKQDERLAKLEQVIAKMNE